jgi:L-fuculokinase
MNKDVVMVLDCGATNARAIAVDLDGDIVAQSGRPNAPAPQPGKPRGWLVWDLQEVWGRLSEACREACAAMDSSRIGAVTVTTFGADGAPVDSAGRLTHPIICWQDVRTEPLAAAFAERMDPWRAFATTGYQVIPFDSLLRLIWLRENAPEALDGAETYLMMPGILSYQLCGERSIDPTIGSTMMAMDMARRDWSAEMLGLAGVAPSLFPTWREPGEVIGQVTRHASEQTGLPAGIAVTAAGHDTQFAAVGSGAQPGEAVLSSGTWEILLLRSRTFSPTPESFEQGLIYECDPEPGMYHPQLLMMGSSVLEWIRAGFFDHIEERGEAYQEMIARADRAGIGAGGVTILPSLVAATGPTKRYGTKGTILGLGMDTDGGQLYRAGLEGLSFQMRHALEILTAATGTSPGAIRTVGGGSRNALWNQIRADVTGLPVTTIEQVEATVLGAAMFAFIGLEQYGSVAEAQQGMARGMRTTEPSAAQAEYDALYRRYRLAAPALQEFYAQ